MAAPPVNPVVLDLMPSFGAILIGSIFSCVIWGISCMQMFLYYLNYDSDPLSLRLFVAFVWAFDTANEILLLSSMWPVLITNWGSLAQLEIMAPPLIHHGWVSGVVAFAVQMFFLHRIYRFSGNKRILPIIMIPLALWPVVIQVPYDIWLFNATSSAILSTRRMIAFEMAVRATGAFIDILIAAAMVYLLSKNRRSPFSRSEKMLFRLIMVTINTGLWTAIIAVVDFSLIAAFPSGLQFCAFEFPLSSLYVNTLLGNLNARKFIKKGDTDFMTYIDGDSGSGSLALRNVTTNRSGTVVGTGKKNSSVAIRVDTANIVDVGYPSSTKNASTNAVAEL